MREFRYQRLPFEYRFARRQVFAQRLCDARRERNRFGANDDGVHGVVHRKRLCNSRQRYLEQLPVELGDARVERTHQSHGQRSYSAVARRAKHDDLVAHRHTEIARKRSSRIRFGAAPDVTPLCDHGWKPRNSSFTGRIYAKQLGAVAAVVAGDERKRRDASCRCLDAGYGAHRCNARGGIADRVLYARVVEVAHPLQLQVTVQQMRRVVDHGGVRAALHRHGEQQQRHRERDGTGTEQRAAPIAPQVAPRDRSRRAALPSDRFSRAVRLA